VYVAKFHAYFVIASLVLSKIYNKTIFSASCSLCNYLDKIYSLSVVNLETAENKHETDDSDAESHGIRYENLRPQTDRQPTGSVTRRQNLQLVMN